MADFELAKVQAHKLFPGENKESANRRAIFYTIRRYSKGPKFWIVWNPYGKAPRRKHLTVKSAEAEAYRLCQLQPGNVFAVLEAKHIVAKIGKSWKMIQIRY